MNKKEILELCYYEEKATFEGWDFSHLNNRMVTDKLVWDYDKLVKQHMQDIGTLLDMGTGGGEFLSSLDDLPTNTYATEAYIPNVPIAKEKLEPLGVTVKQIETDDNLPFIDTYFDLIINRHEAYDVDEVYRILKPNSIFITQQVGGMDINELNELMGIENGLNMPYWNNKYAEEQLRNKGFRILKSIEQYPITRFYDIGAIVYLMKIIEWQFQDFSVEKYQAKLLDIQNQINKEGYLGIKAHRFLVIAEKE